MTFEEFFKATGYKPYMKPALEEFWYASREHMAECTCPRATISGKNAEPCMFFDMETEECKYGKI
jgi:hypothetical protein